MIKASAASIAVWVLPPSLAQRSELDIRHCSAEAEGLGASAGAIALEPFLLLGQKLPVQLMDLEFALEQGHP